MLGEQIRNGANTLLCTLLELPLAKCPLHLSADRRPTSISHALVNATVGDDLDGAIGQQDIDQDTAIVLGIPNTQCREQVDGALARGESRPQCGHAKVRLDDKTQLAVMAMLAVADRCLDLPQ